MMMKIRKKSEFFQPSGTLQIACWYKSKSWISLGKMMLMMMMLMIIMMTMSTKKKFMMMIMKVAILLVMIITIVIGMEAVTSW